MAPGKNVHCCDGRHPCVFSTRADFSEGAKLGKFVYNLDTRPLSRGPEKRERERGGGDCKRSDVVAMPVKLC